NQPFLLLINMMEAHSPYLHNDLGDTAYNQAITKCAFSSSMSATLTNLTTPSLIAMCLDMVITCNTI
ncbi:MAG: hypothetical protein RXR31_06455, partial [Thermoproteota archaeon]